MKQIYVAMEFAGKAHPVGVIRFDAAQNFGYFSYLPTYEGPPLDPINLDYRKPFVPGVDRFRRAERVFVVDPVKCPGLMHQVFVDAMPGQWGMAVLQAEYPEIRQMREAERLHWMGARTTGALSFFVQARANENTVHGLDQLEIVRAKCAEFMAKLQKMGLDGVRNPAVASHGGVMPKAAYEDGSGRHWIAKFDRPGEGLQYTLLENAASLMARRCGITVPKTKAIADEVDGHIFLTERFDRTGRDKYHKASFMTLTGAKEAGTGDYRDVFEVLRQVADPARWPAQRDEMLRRMAFNVGLNVTDDHLRNHEVRLMPDGSWELSPAFDLVPVSGSAPHQCAIFGKARMDINLDKPATKAFWTEVASQIGASAEHVHSIVREVATALKNEWPALVESCGMNRFNQMNALMAAEVGCGIPFPSSPKQAPVVPLTSEAVEHLKAAAKTINKAAALFKGAVVTNEQAVQVSKELMTLNSDAPKLSLQLRQAGKAVVADALSRLSLRTASSTVLEANPADRHLANDFEEAEAQLRAALASIQRAAPAGAKRAPS